MLAEMGVRVWAPDAAPPAAPAAASAPVPAPAQAPTPAPRAQAPAAAAPVAAPPARPVVTPPSPPHAGLAAWRLDAPRPLYAAAGGQAAAPAWLIALDSPTPDDPGGGEAGELLHKMLAAMGLQGGPRVFVSTVRRAAPGAGEGEQQAWAQALEHLRPALVLALGQSAARCVLGGGEPLALLRTREHRLASGTPVVVSYAPAYLLRTPKAKREAWADLQRAMALAQGPARMP